MTEVTKVPVERFPCGCVGIRVSEERKVERQSRYEYTGCTAWLFHVCDSCEDYLRLCSIVREVAWCVGRGESPRVLTKEEFGVVVTAIGTAGFTQERHFELRRSLLLDNPPAIELSFPEVRGWRQDIVRSAARSE